MILHVHYFHGVFVTEGVRQGVVEKNKYGVGI